MKPKTIFQKKICKLNKKVRPINSWHKKWAFKNCLEHNAVMLKSGKTTCLDCGHTTYEKVKEVWHELVVEKKCPNCKTKIKVVNTRKKVFNQYAYFVIIDNYKEYQLIRYVYVDAYYKSGNKAIVSYKEVSRIWLDENGKYEVFGMIAPNWNSYWRGDFELRNKKNISKYSFKCSNYYPNLKVIPKIKRNGFKGGFYNIEPFDLFLGILTNNRLETIFKANQFELFNYSVNQTKKLITDYWGTIKIALKNNYIIANPSDYYDYLRFLEEYNKDILNRKYVCPENLHKEHQKFIQRRQSENRKKELEETKKEIKKDEEFYRRHISKYKHLKFVEDNMKITPFKNVEQVYLEGKFLKHCVFERHYHRKGNSLLLSVSVDDVVVETVEVNLVLFRINQIRGMDNCQTEFYDKTKKLVEKNMKLIEKAKFKKKSKKELELC